MFSPMVGPRAAITSNKNWRYRFNSCHLIKKNSRLIKKLGDIFCAYDPVKQLKYYYCNANLTYEASPIRCSGQLTSILFWSFNIRNLLHLKELRFSHQSSTDSFNFSNNQDEQKENDFKKKSFTSFLDYNHTHIHKFIHLTLTQ